MTYSITLLGKPVSVNHLWRSAVGKFGKPYSYATPEGVLIKQTWQLMAMTQMRTAGASMTDSKSVALSIKFYFPDHLRRDIDNFLKAVLDCLTGIAYKDDCQIQTLKVVKSYDAKNPRIEINIKY